MCYLLLQAASTEGTASIMAVAATTESKVDLNINEMERVWPRWKRECKILLDRVQIDIYIGLTVTCNLVEWILTKLGTLFRICIHPDLL